MCNNVRCERFERMESPGGKTSHELPYTRVLGMSNPNRFMTKGKENIKREKRKGEGKERYKDHDCTPCFTLMALDSAFPHDSPHILLRPLLMNRICVLLVIQIEFFLLCLDTNRQIEVEIKLNQI